MTARALLWRTGLGALFALLALVAIWICALVFLPDAPGRITPAAAVHALLHASGGRDRTDVEGILAVPIAGVRRMDLRDSWGDPRDNGLRVHHGTDIMAPVNTPILAAAPGTVEKLFTSAAGGTTLYIRSPGGNWTYYYAHLEAYAPGLHEGQALRSGDLVGYVGDTGNAGAGNYHLHFGLAHTTPDQHWYQGEDVNPYPYLAGKTLPK